MAQHDDARVCPHCGEGFTLGSCPIVATGLSGLRHIGRLESDQVSYDDEGYLVKAGADQSPPVRDYADDGGKASSAAAALFGSGRAVAGSPRPDWHPESVQISRPPTPPPPSGKGLVGRLLEKPPPDLPSPEELVPEFLRELGVRGLMPVRACPGCRHPLPKAIDDREVFTIVVAGTTAASKTTFQVELIRTDRPAQHKAHFEEFSLSEESPEDVLDILEQTRSGYFATNMKDTGYPPWILHVTGQRRGVPSMLFLYDLPGEAYSNRQYRVEQAEFLRFADGLLVLVDPEPFLEGKGARQTRMVNGLVNDVAPEAHIAIVLAKADLVGLRPGELWTERQVKDQLEKMGARGVIEAALSGSINDGSRVSFHAVSANPGGTGQEESYGVFTAFLAVLECTDVG